MVYIHKTDDLAFLEELASMENFFLVMEVVFILSSTPQTKQQ